MDSSILALFNLILLAPHKSNTQVFKSCGRPLGTQFQMKEERIVGGYDVGYYRYPWFVALERHDNIACGGALIAPNAVISAAHCYKDYLTKPDLDEIKLQEIYNITMGVYDICKPEKTQKTYEINKVYIHEKYKDNVPYYDISLLILNADTSDFQPICLPRVMATKPKEGTVPGLGSLKYQGDPPCTLHEARILIYPDKECRKMINKTGNDPNKMVNSLCAGYIQGGIDTCQGDSGGPLQIVDENGNFVLLGVVSFGFGCADPGLLGIYTDVSQYVDWIVNKAGLNLLNEANKTTSTTTSAPQPHKKIKIESTFMRPITIIIKRRNKSIVMKKNNLHRPRKLIGP